MKILLVCPQPEYTSDVSVGVQVRIKKLAESFSRHNQVVHLNAALGKSKIIQKGDDSKFYFKQWSLGGEYLSMFTDFNPGYLLQLKKIANIEKVDLIFIIGGPYGVISARLMCPNIPVIYSSESVKHDSAYLTFETVKNNIPLFKTSIIRTFSKLLLTSYLRILERWTCKQASHISVLSDQIKFRYQELYGLKSDKFTVIPGFLGSGRFRSEPRIIMDDVRHDMIRIVFHGPYSNPANADAFQLILNYIAPEVQKYNRNIVFIIAGADMPIFEKENVKSLGFIEDLADLLENCDIAIIPMMHGEGGVKGKTRDYLAAGLAIVTTPEGITGINVEDGKHAVIINTVDRNFINAILDLANDEVKRRMLGINALAFAKKNYDYNIINATVDDMLKTISDNF